MKRFKTLCCLLWFLLPGPLFAQTIVDPNDPLYTYLTIWHVKGFIKQLPVIRPYPLQTIRDLLREVLDRAEGTDLEMARSFHESLRLDSPAPRMSPGYLLSTMHGGASVDVMADGSTHYASGKLRLDTTGFLNDVISYSGKVGLNLTDSPGDAFFPKWSSVMDESLTGGGVFAVDGKNLAIGQLGQFGIFLGSGNLYLQAGLMRTAFGPSFESSVVVGPQAPAAGHVSFTFRNGWLSFSTLLLDLVAREYYDDLTGELLYFNYTVTPMAKYLVLHTLSVRPWDWLEAGVIQTVVTGEILHWYYIVPFPLQNLFYSAQLSGDYDTSFIGLFAKIRLPFGLALEGTFYVDDWDSFSALSQKKGILVNFDSARNKFALDAVLSYCPPIDVLRRILIEYQMVTPYTYTHAWFYAVDWIMYTHAGKKLGSILEPNSDMLALKLMLLPAEWLDVNLIGRMIRHGNASEGIYPGDGTIYDGGFDGETPTVDAPSRFLTQEVIETTLQVGADVGCAFRFDWGKVAGRLGYTFEYVWNRDLVAGADGPRHYIDLSLGYRY